MCGILAIVGPHQPTQLQSGLESMAHRGPDHRGSFSEPGVGLAQTRLAIIDLETGAQPLHSDDGQLVLVANGEFYEHDRHLESLIARGHRPKSRSDSELALYFYRELGVEFLHRLRGEFAFCLWDRRRRTLMAARDRFGIKPLFYARHQGCLYLASEVKALWAAGVPARWDSEGVFQSLHLCQHQDRTLFDRVFQVPPGHYLRYDDSGLGLHSYWDQRYPRRCLSVSPEEAVDEVGRLLHEAVRIRTRADVPLACYLSGGVDSSSVLALARRHLSKVAAFTIAFEHHDYDESSLAQQMAAHAEADFYPVRVSGGQLADAFEQTVIQGENVVYNGHAPARYLLSRALHQAGYKAALGGEGADELFAGYHFCQRALEGGGRPFSALLRLICPATQVEKRLSAVSPLLSVAVKGLGLPAEIVDYLAAKLFEIRDLATISFLEQHRGRDPYREFLAQFAWGRLWRVEPAKQLLYVWMRSAFVNYVLAAERLDMAHAVELRLPFLDHRLFEYLRGLPGDLLYPGRKNKYLLRQTVAPYVTRAVLEQTKRPFLAPPARHSELHGRLLELIRSPELEQIPFLDGGRVLEFLERRGNDPAYDPLLFYLASLVVLQREYRL